MASTLFTRGKCRSCGGRIDPLHFAVETAGALLAGAALLLQPNLHGAALAAFWLLLIAPAVLDTKFFWLPDRLTAVLAAAGLLLGGVATGASLADGLIGGAAGFAVLALLAAAYLRFRGRDGLGGGDPKLLGAIGLWTGWTALPFILVLASLGGLAIAAARRDKLDGRMPFGALLAGAAIAWTGLEAWRNAVGA